MVRVIGMNEIKMDSILLRDQPVAHEGVLEYDDGNKLKRWDDLKNNIGLKVPIIDEHPDPGNGAEGLYSGKETVFGIGEIKQCPNGKKALCADLLLDDGAPVKTGYSIGYPYRELDEKGECNGKKYDQVQSKLVIDHIALTDSPRDNRALQVAPDSKLAIFNGKIGIGTDSNTINSAAIVINRIGHDSHSFSRDGSTHGDIKKKLARDNPGMSGDEINARANVMYRNEKYLKREGNMPEDKKKEETDQEESEEEKKKKEKESKDSTKTADSLSREELVAEVARYRAIADSNAENDSKTRTLELKLKRAQDNADKFKGMYEDLLTQNVQVKLDSLVNSYKFDAKEFEGKHAEFVAGALYASDRLNRGIAGDSSVPQPGNDSRDETLSINDYIYDHDSKKMIRRKRE